MVLGALSWSSDKRVFVVVDVFVEIFVKLYGHLLTVESRGQHNLMPGSTCMEEKVRSNGLPSRSPFSQN